MAEAKTDDVYYDEDELVKELPKLNIYSGVTSFEDSRGRGSVRRTIEWKTE